MSFHSYLTLFRYLGLLSAGCNFQQSLFFFWSWFQCLNQWNRWFLVSSRVWSCYNKYWMKKAHRCVYCCFWHNGARVPSVWLRDVCLYPLWFAYIKKKTADAVRMNEKSSVLGGPKVQFLLCSISNTCNIWLNLVFVLLPFFRAGVFRWAWDSHQNGVFLSVAVYFISLYPSRVPASSRYPSSSRNDLEKALAPPTPTWLFLQHYPVQECRFSKCCCFKLTVT